MDDLADKQADVRTRVDREADNQQLLQLEEKDVVSSVASLLSDLCGPGDWMPMEKLHSEVNCFSYIAVCFMQAGYSSNVSLSAVTISC